MENIIPTLTAIISALWALITAYGTLPETVPGVLWARRVGTGFRKITGEGLTVPELQTALNEKKEAQKAPFFETAGEK